VAGFIVSQRAQHGVPYAVSCRALGVSQSWFYKWKDGDHSLRRARRDRLKAEVARLFAARKGKDGSPRITAALKDAGWAVSENTVAALMREMGLAARRGKGRKATTRPGKGRWRAPDLVKRSFAAAAVNVKWYGDGTGIVTAEGKLHLASVLDMGSRRILGFALSEHPDAELAYSALVMAVAVRGGQVPGVISSSGLRVVALGGGGGGGQSLHQIAAAIGTSHRILLYHFGSWEGLLVAICNEINEAVAGS
jgi:transposase InsO family protein